MKTKASMTYEGTTLGIRPAVEMVRESVRQMGWSLAWNPSLPNITLLKVLDNMLDQKRLNTPADGIFGPQTEQAVKNWQRVHDEHGNVVPPGKGLIVDGIVGPKTWYALFA